MSKQKAKEILDRWFNEGNKIPDFDAIIKCASDCGAVYTEYSFRKLIKIAYNL